MFSASVGICIHMVYIYSYRRTHIIKFCSHSVNKIVWTVTFKLCDLYITRKGISNDNSSISSNNIIINNCKTGFQVSPKELWHSVPLYSPYSCAFSCPYWPCFPVRPWMKVSLPNRMQCRRVENRSAEVHFNSLHWWPATVVIIGNYISGRLLYERAN